MKSRAARWLSSTESHFSFSLFVCILDGLSFTASTSSISSSQLTSNITSKPKLQGRTWELKQRKGNLLSAEPGNVLVLYC